MQLRLLLITTGMALLAACASSGPKLYSDTDPGADFAGYRTYAFEPVLGTDKVGYSSILSQNLKSAVARELEARGYTLRIIPICW